MSLTSLKQDRCESCPIRHRAVCSKCNADELLQLEKIKYYRSYEAGQTIIWRGDQMDIVASVVTGTATISQTMEDGRTQMLGILLPSDFIGRPGRETALYDIVAASDVTLCCFRRLPFEALVETTPHIGQRLLEMSLDELDAARDWMLLLGRKTAREKIASFLTLVVRRTTGAPVLPGAISGQSVDLPLTREAMANYLGLTLETVSRQFSKLKADGVISLEGSRRVKIPDFARLWSEAGNDAEAEMS